MGKSRASNIVKGQSTAASSTKLTTHVTKPMLAYGSNTLRLVATIKQLNGAWSGTFRYRTFAASLMEPTAWTNGLVNLNAVGEYAEDITLSGNFLWIQCGLAAGATTGAAEAYAELAGFVKGNGVMLAAETFDIDPDVNTGSSSYYIINRGPVPLLGLNGLMFGAIATGVAGTLTWNVAWRLTKSNLENPSAWVDLLGTDARANANSQWNSGDLAVSSSANAWGDLALKVVSTAARGRLQLFAGGKYS